MAPGGRPAGSSKTDPPSSSTKQGTPPYLQKIDSHLLDLLADYQSGKDPVQAAQGLGLVVDSKRGVLVDVYVYGSLAQSSSDLTKLGMSVQSTSEAYNVVEGFLPIDQVVPTAQKEVVKGILAVIPNQFNSTQP